MGTAMKKHLLLVGLLIALVAFVSGDSDKEDEAYVQEKELDLLDRKLRNADPRRREQSGKIKSQGRKKKRQRNKDEIKREKKGKPKSTKQKKNGKKVQKKKADSKVKRNQRREEEAEK